MSTIFDATYEGFADDPLYTQHTATLKPCLQRLRSPLLHVRSFAVHSFLKNAYLGPPKWRRLGSSHGEVP